MTEGIVTYRDDGPVAAVLARWMPATALSPALLQLVASLAMGGLLALDGGRTTALTVAGFGAFLLLGAAASKAATARPQWLVNPLLRAGEYGLVLCLGWRAGAAGPAVAYALLAATAYHHYDVVYRWRHRDAGPPAWLTRLGGGWDGRTLLLVAAAAGGAFVPAAVALASWCAVLYVSESVSSWLAVARRERQEPVAAGRT